MNLTCEIVLDKSRITAGEELRGEIQYTSLSELHVTNLIVLFYGKASRIRRMTSANNAEPAQIHKEIVFCEQTSLLGHYQEERSGEQEEIILPIGVTKLPIRAKLPIDIPSSFYCKHGIYIYSIVYTVEIYRYATYEKCRDAAMVFDVIASSNLCVIPSVMKRLEIDEELVHVCCCFPTGNIILNSNLPKTGYLAGSDMEINLECSNQTYFGIDMLKLYLCLKITYYPFNNKNNDDDDDKITALSEKLYEFNMSEVNFGSIQSGELRKFQRTLHIPPIEPWNVDKCKIFKIKYYLVFKAIFPFPLRSIKKKFPIIIGNMDDPASPRQLLFLKNIADADRTKLKQKLLAWNRSLVQVVNETETSV